MLKKISAPRTVPVRPCEQNVQKLKDECFFMRDESSPYFHPVVVRQTLSYLTGTTCASTVCTEEEEDRVGLGFRQSSIRFELSSKCAYTDIYCSRFVYCVQATARVESGGRGGKNGRVPRANPGGGQHPGSKHSPYLPGLACLSGQRMVHPSLYAAASGEGPNCMPYTRSLRSSPSVRMVSFVFIHP